MIKRNIAECIIMNKNGEFLMQKKTLDYPTEAGGKWCFFGGTIEKGESPEGALIRELKEELNLIPEKVILIRKENYKIKDKYFGDEYLFAYKFLGDLSDLILSEGAGFAFFDKTELESLKVADLYLPFLKEIIDEVSKRVD